MSNKKRLFILLSILLIQVLILAGVFAYQLFPKKVQADSSSWIQTDWTGGSGQSNWSDAAKYSSVTGEGLYNSTDLRMKINADVVIGQPDFTSGSVNQGGSPAANTLKNNYGVNANGTKLFIADYGNNRVLIYNTIPASNNASADVVIGQLDFTSNSANQGGSPAANTLKGPVHAFSDGVRLFIADNDNHRVLIYNTIPASNNASADVVIGQADFSGGSVNQGGLAGGNTLRNPFSVYSDGNKLFIADDFNHRVLIYNTIPASNNASADVVIGQLDFTSNSANQGGSPAANTLNDVLGVYLDGTRLFVTDKGNHRVLIYNTIPASNNASADVVIGQPDFISNSANQGGSPAANTLNTSHPLYSSGNRLFIPDYRSARILVYNTIPTSNNASADIVIGQPNFTSSERNQGGSLKAFTMDYPRFNVSDGNRLIVGDGFGYGAFNNNRVLIYNFTPVSTTLTSSIFDAGSEQEWGPITWTASTPANTSITMEISTDQGATWTAVTNGQSYIAKSQTMQYRATLSNTDGISTPTFSDITINYAANANPSAFGLSFPADNQGTSNNFPTLSWDASFDNESGLAKYQLYIDGVLDTDNISSVSVVPRNSLSCANHTWRVRAIDNAGNYTDSSTFNLTIICGGGLPPAAYNPPAPPATTKENPEGSFKVLINDGIETTDNRTVTLKFFAGPDTKRMAISESSDFKDAIQEEYIPAKTWVLAEPDGIKTIYAKFFTQYGQSSAVVSDSIILKTKNTENQDGQNQEPPAASDILPDGSLIRAINDYKVYLTAGRLRRHIPNPEVFTDYGFSWTDVKDVAPEVIAEYRQVDLIKELEKEKVYYLSPSGIKKWIPTPDIFNSYGNKWEDVQIISKKEMDSYPVSNLMGYNNQIYLIQGAVKRLIPNETILKRYDSNLILDANKMEFEWFKSGSNVK